MGKMKYPNFHYPGSIRGKPIYEHAALSETVSTESPFLAQLGVMKERSHRPWLYFVRLGHDSWVKKILIIKGCEKGEIKGKLLKILR